jgi:hypothetical protein
MIEGAMGLVDYFTTMAAKQPYNFGGAQMDAATFFASETAKAERDE